MTDSEEDSGGCQLYLVSPPKIVLDDFIPQFEAAIETGHVACFQLRLKEASDAQILEAAEKLLAVCRHANIPFILNDRPDLAAQIGADGVHLGQDDMPVEEARRIVGEECVIGVTAHASKHLAMEAAEQGADYVAFGAFYPTTSKPQEKIDQWGVPDVDILNWWCTVTTIPCVAIGGITPENCAPLAEAGADFVAMITSVWNHPSGAAAAVNAFAEQLARAQQA